MSRFSDFGNKLYTGERSIDFIGRRNVFFILSAIIIALTVGLTFARGGFNLGIEFKGGSEFQITGVSQVDEAKASDAVNSIVPNTTVHTTLVGANNLRIQTPQLTPDDSEAVRLALAKSYGVESSAVASSFIGANWGSDVTSKALNGLIVFFVLAAIAMALYFRTIKMSIAALVALAHDLIITTGIYGALGFEVTPAAVIGFLTILGYSLYDTVVVFDKIRENTFEVEFSETATFAERVNLAINQTLVRSINTTVVAVLPVASILFIGTLVLGAGTLRDIALALFIGMLVGTYSTIFVASPFYSLLRERETKFAKGEARVLASR